MHQSMITSDGNRLAFDDSEIGTTALIFAHGWLGNRSWWDAQLSAFRKDFRVIRVDLVGHGASSRERTDWSMDQHAADIVALIDHLYLENVILVGHSMSGTIAVKAANRSPAVKKVVLVDTLHHVAQMPTLAQVAPLFAGLRSDYAGTMRSMVPAFMFGPATPEAVTERIVGDFLGFPPELAIAMLEPFYAASIVEDCQRLKIPVRAIMGDKFPTDIEMNRSYIKDYECAFMNGVGHYPMLDESESFNQKLAASL